MEPTAERLRRRSWTTEGRRQSLPVFEIQAVVEDVQRDEELMPPEEARCGLASQLTQWIASSMEDEGDQIQRRQQVGRSVLAVPEVALHAAAVFSAC